VTVLTATASEPNVRLTMTPHRRSTECSPDRRGARHRRRRRGPGRRHPAHRPRQHVLEARGSATRSRSTAAASPSPSATATLDRRRHAGDPRQDLAAGVRPATGVTSSAR
jgi:hypothetical protein